MTDGTQELDEILERYRLHANMAYSEVEDNFRTAEEFKTLALPKVLDEAKQAIQSLIRTEKLKLLDEVIHQSTINLKSAKAVAGWAELRKKQLEEDVDKLPKPNKPPHVGDWWWL